MINAKKVPSKGNYERPEPLEPGTYPARLVQVIGLGLQPQRAYKGAEKPPAYMLKVTYELADEFLKDEDGEDDPTKPRWVWEDFPLHSLDSDLAKSTKRYLALDPEIEHDGDWAGLLGKPCNVTIVVNEGKDGNIYENVGAVTTMRAKDAAKLPPLVHEPVAFDPDSDDVETFLSFGDRIQSIIKEHLEFEGSALDLALQAHEKGGASKDKKAQKKAEKKRPDPEPEEPEVDEDDERDW